MVALGWQKKLPGSLKDCSSVRIVGQQREPSAGLEVELQRLSTETGMAITVCHYPPGTSKWNKIEHRLFSFISLNWKGEPLVNYETVVNLIGGTRTRSGLSVKAVLDTREYETGIEITAKQIQELSIRKHSVHPDWNYTFSPSQVC